MGDFYTWHSEIKNEKLDIQNLWMPFKMIQLHQHT